MDAAKFVGHLRSYVIDENLEIYKKLFEETPALGATDPYWKTALNLFEKLNAEQRMVFFEVIRQVIVDTTANVLGVVDGVNSIYQDNEVYELRCEGVVISGDLQSVFLAEEERTQRKK